MTMEVQPQKHSNLPGHLVIVTKGGRVISWSIAATKEESIQAARPKTDSETIAQYFGYDEWILCTSEYYCTFRAKTIIVETVYYSQWLQAFCCYHETEDKS